MDYLLPCGQLQVLPELNKKTILQLRVRACVRAWVCEIVMLVMGKGIWGPEEPGTGDNNCARTGI